MHAIFTVSIIEADRLEEADALIREKVVPSIKGSPGFVSGTIARAEDNSEGRGMFVFETQEQAQNALNSIPEIMPENSPITVKTTRLFEIKAQF